MSIRAKPWEVPDALWERILPLLPYSVLHTAIGWEHLPQEFGFGCGITAWRRLRAWQQAGVWEKLHELLLAELHAADQLEWSRAVADSSYLQAKKGARKPVPARSTAGARAASTTCS
jgi:transposase